MNTNDWFQRGVSVLRHTSDVCRCAPSAIRTHASDVFVMSAATMPDADTSVMCSSTLNGRCRRNSTCRISDSTFSRSSVHQRWNSSSLANASRL